ncbi:MAG: triphosphoribosyl-dephospho-CoA synthase [Hyphomicrobiaceae bacterium]|nr:triphosphoribosyl-dephospho-CoA synthase [Hyphomicrobiaceae bacterium]
MNGTAPAAGAAPSGLSAAFLRACRAELTALKPGNVHIHAGGHGMEVRQFELAAEAAAPFIGDAVLRVGARIRAAVEASMAAAGCNTNLGIILLCAPLAAAALRHEPSSLRDRVKTVLEELDDNDASDVYAAIRAANPGGLGKSDTGDVSQEPTLPILDAMALAAPRDRIAANYAFGLRDIFDDHLPLLLRLRARQSGHAPGNPDEIVSSLYMSILARFPDSHIQRKFGMETAAHVQRLARAARHDWEPFVTPKSYTSLLRLDAMLKQEGWNPGTSADFVVATLFAADL